MLLSATETCPDAVGGRVSERQSGFVTFEEVSPCDLLESCEIGRQTSHWLSTFQRWHTYVRWREPTAEWLLICRLGHRCIWQAYRPPYICSNNVLDVLKRCVTLILLAVACGVLAPPRHRLSHTATKLSPTTTVAAFLAVSSGYSVVCADLSKVTFESQV